MKSRKQNIIETYRAKTKYIIATNKDQNGTIVDMDAYDYYLYAKKYPVNPDAALDISIGPILTTVDACDGTVTFGLYPFDASLIPGDYKYEIVAKEGGREITIIQDTLKILDTLVPAYSTGLAIFDPNSYDFTIFDTSILVEFFYSEIGGWTSIIPDWLTINPSTGISSGFFALNLIHDPSTSQDDNVQFDISGYGIKEMPVTFTIGPLAFVPADYVFNIDAEDISLGLDVSTRSINNWNIVADTDLSWFTYDISSGIGNGTIDISLNIATFNGTVATNKQITIDSSYYYTQTFDASVIISTPLGLFPISHIFSIDAEDISLGLDVSTGTYNTWKMAPDTDNWFTYDISSGSGDGIIDISLNLITFNGTAATNKQITVDSSFYGSQTFDASIITITPLSLDISTYTFRTLDGSLTFDISTGTYNKWYIPIGS